MVTAWHYEFAPHILARGKKYFEEGRVFNISQCENRITAQVKGTEDYHVEIDLPGGVPYRLFCTCPHASRNHCKHQAAVLFAIETGEFTFTDDSPDFEDDDLYEPPLLPWQNAIETLSFDTLRGILSDYAAHNSELQEQLAIWYLKGLPEGLLVNWTASLQRYADTQAAGHRYVPEDKVRIFLYGVRKQAGDRLRLLRKVGATMDAFYWLGSAFETASNMIYPTAKEEFEYFCSECEEAWDALFSEATGEQRKEMQTWFWEHRAAFFAHAHGAEDVSFLYICWGDDLERAGLKIVDELITNCRNDKELAFLMDCRVEIMGFLDCSCGEVRSFWRQHLSHDCARHRLLKSYSGSAEDRKHIVPLLNQLKEIDADDLPRLIKDSVWLAMMHREENAEEAYLSELALLLTQHRQALEQALPGILDKKSAERFIICLDAMRSLKDDIVDQMIEELVHKLCSSPSVARRGIVEMINASGYEWPKPYRFPGK